MKSSDEVLDSSRGITRFSTTTAYRTISEKHPERESAPESRGYWANGRIQ